MQKSNPNQTQIVGITTKTVEISTTYITNQPQPAPIGTLYLQTAIGTQYHVALPENANGAPYPLQIRCPHCKMQGITNVTPKVGRGTYILSCLLFVVTGIACFWVPYVMPDCQDKIHQCSSCSTIVGIKYYEVW